MRSQDLPVAYVFTSDSCYFQTVRQYIVGMADFFVFSLAEDFFTAFSFFLPDLVLVDLAGWPDSLFLATIRKIKSLPDSHKITFLGIGNSYNIPLLKAAFQAGLEDYIHKDTHPEILGCRLESILFHSRLRLQMHPLTGLPGIGLIEDVYNKRQNRQQACSVAYLDLNNFKSFNDEKGVKAGDRAIQSFSSALLYLRKNFSRKELFAGHLGGDDFFLLGDKTAVGNCCQQLLGMFEKSILHFFTAAEVESGYYSGKDRNGQSKNFPLLAVAVVVIHIAPGTRVSFDDISLLAVHLKKQAKLAQKSCIVEEEYLAGS